MNIRAAAVEIKQEATGWRRAMHQNPQTAYEETFAADLIAKQLTAWQIPFESGIAETGIVATVRGRVESTRTLGLRADMDALDIDEKTTQPWKSNNDHKMHACGHDGHTAMLLGAAKCLSDAPDFAGTVRLIFQPAEEGRRGADRMLEEGLFERFQCDQIFALHNSPWLPLGLSLIHI